MSAFFMQIIIQRSPPPRDDLKHGKGGIIGDD
jgi:hypothetical protein